MMWRVRELLEGGGELLRAEAEIAAERLRKSMLDALLFGAGLAFGLIAALTLLAALAIVLAEEVGWAGSLGIIGGGLFLIALIAALPAMSRLRNGEPRRRPSPRVRAAESREQMADAANPNMTRTEALGEPEPAGSVRIPADIDELKAVATEFVTKHPAAVASGAFLALSLIGPFRAVRLISRGLAVAGLAATVVEAVKAEKEETTNRPPDASRPRPTPGRAASGVSEDSYAAPYRAPAPPPEPKPVAAHQRRFTIDD